MGFIRDLPKIWSLMNGWLKAGVVWMIAWSITNLVLIEVHSRTPGPYRTPDKVAVRKGVAAARIAGMLFLVLPGIVVASKRIGDPELKTDHPPAA
jgi:hypothetical protein